VGTAGHRPTSLHGLRAAPTWRYCPGGRLNWRIQQYRYAEAGRGETRPRRRSVRRWVRRRPARINSSQSSTRGRGRLSCSPLRHARRTLRRRRPHPQRPLPVHPQQYLRDETVSPVLFGGSGNATPTPSARCSEAARKRTFDWSATVKPCSTQVSPPGPHPATVVPLSEAGRRHHWATAAAPRADNTAPRRPVLPAGLLDDRNPSAPPVAVGGSPSCGYDQPAPR
jgi:hypothetical protein